MPITVTNKNLEGTVVSHTLEGPYISTDSIEDKAGVYAILCKLDDGKMRFLDAGESSKVKSDIDNNTGRDLWKSKARALNGTLYYAVLYTPNLKEEERKKIRTELPAGEVLEDLVGECVDDILKDWGVNWLSDE